MKKINEHRWVCFRWTKIGNLRWKTCTTKVATLNWNTRIERLIEACYSWLCPSHICPIWLQQWWYWWWSPTKAVWKWLDASRTLGNLMNLYVWMPWVDTSSKKTPSNSWDSQTSNEARSAPPSFPIRSCHVQFSLPGCIRMFINLMFCFKSWIDFIYDSIIPNVNVTTLSSHVIFIWCSVFSIHHLDPQKPLPNSHEVNWRPTTRPGCLQIPLWAHQQQPQQEKIHGMVRFILQKHWITSNSRVFFTSRSETCRDLRIVYSD